MNSLTDPGVAELLERLHREADAQMPELRKRVAAAGKDEQASEHWFQELRDATWVRDAANGFVSSSITLKSGTEYSIWVNTTTEEVPES